MSKTAERWRARAATLRAMTLLLLARSLITLVPLRHWRDRLGWRSANPDIARASRLAAQVERAAWRLPFQTKCLPRAMALSWLLRRYGLAHQVVLAIRPQDRRSSPDALHAWIEAGGERVLGDLPGPWFELQRLPPAE